MDPNPVLILMFLVAVSIAQNVPQEQGPTGTRDVLKPAPSDAIMKSLFSVDPVFSAKVDKHQPQDVNIFFPANNLEPGPIAVKSSGLSPIVNAPALGVQFASSGGPVVRPADKVPVLDTPVFQNIGTVAIKVFPEDPSGTAPVAPTMTAIRKDIPTQTAAEQPVRRPFVMPAGRPDSRPIVQVPKPTENPVPIPDPVPRLVLPVPRPVVKPEQAVKSDPISVSQPHAGPEIVPIVNPVIEPARISEQIAVKKQIDPVQQVLGSKQLTDTSNVHEVTPIDRILLPTQPADSNSQMIAQSSMPTTKESIPVPNDGLKIPKFTAPATRAEFDRIYLVPAILEYLQSRAASPLSNSSMPESIYLDWLLYLRQRLYH
ncbi:hypothetical protein CHS0354_021437 [Potamilus streckersoni]|uniref:Uncharacterized protein n=1 Tax=Potamilus streckersoni TaxID=2493646 RepID=A0AAE0S1W3_9BIVA|nr:hypothetical protein CHS0354_021437 [Potamilus streckersoni]